MNVEIFSVFDMAAHRYQDPFPAPTVEFALREFRRACTHEGTPFANYPEDYALYHVGSFDAELGVMSEVLARKIANASSMIGPQINLEEEA